LVANFVLYFVSFFSGICGLRNSAQKIGSSFGTHFGGTDRRKFGNGLGFGGETVEKIGNRLGLMPGKIRQWFEGVGENKSAMV